MKNQLKITLRDGKAAYFGGEYMTGLVELTISKQINIRGVDLTLYGLEDLHINGSVIHQKDDFLKQRIDLVGNAPTGEQSIAPGTYVWSFSTQLPLRLPGTCKFMDGDLYYYLLANADVKMGSDLRFRQDVNISGDIYENTQFLKPTPFTQSNNKTFLIGTGDLTCRVTVNKKFAFVGDEIQFYVDVNNQSTKKVQSLTIGLVQKNEFARNNVNIVNRKFHYPHQKFGFQVEPHSTGNYTTVVHMPPDVAPTIDQTASGVALKHMTVNYVFRVNLELPLATDLRVNIPMVLKRFNPLLDNAGGAPQAVLYQQPAQAAYHQPHPQQAYAPPPQGYPPAGYQQAPPQHGYPPAQNGYPPAQNGYPQAQGGYPPAQNGYPPAGYAPQSGYPPAQGGYAQPQHGYPPAQHGYPPAQNGYPPAQGGYAPPQSGYPPAQNGYPPAQGGYAPQQAPAPQPPSPQVPVAQSGGYAAPKSGYPPPGAAPIVQVTLQQPQSGYPPPRSGYPPAQPAAPSPQPPVNQSGGYAAPKSGYPPPGADPIIQVTLPTTTSTAPAAHAPLPFAQAPPAFAPQYAPPPSHPSYSALPPPAQGSPAPSHGKDYIPYPAASPSAPSAPSQNYSSPPPQNYSSAPPQPYSPPPAGQNPYYYSPPAQQNSQNPLPATSSQSALQNPAQNSPQNPQLYPQDFAPQSDEKPAKKADPNYSPPQPANNNNNNDGKPPPSYKSHDTDMVD
jgi:hypothetical protein